MVNVSGVVSANLLHGFDQINLDCWSLSQCCTASAASSQSWHVTRVAVGGRTRASCCSRWASCVSVSQVRNTIPSVKLSSVSPTVGAVLPKKVPKVYPVGSNYSNSAAQEKLRPDHRCTTLASRLSALMSHRPPEYCDISPVAAPGALP